MGGVRFDHPVTIGAFVNGKLNGVQITRSSPGLTSSQIREELLKVWHGTFMNAGGAINWAEPTFWNIEATLDYDNRLRSVILTDGWHVQVRDVHGVFWLIRLGN